jgi:hypothetical protein
MHVKERRIVTTFRDSGDMLEPITLAERSAFLKLPMEERRKIMARQARGMAAHYRQEKVEDLEAGEIFEY